MFDNIIPNPKIGEKRTYKQGSLHGFLQTILGFGKMAEDKISTGKHLKLTINLLFLAGIIAFLAYQLTKIGWDEIFQALPQSPLFYLLSIGFVAAPVIAEVLAFQTITDKKPAGLTKLFLRKHVLNKAIMNFSGDAYSIHKISKFNNMGLKPAAIIMKDMTLMRAFVANVWIVGLVVLALCFGDFVLLQDLAMSAPLLTFFISVFSLSVVIAALILFRKLTKLKFSKASKVASIYLIRSVVIGTILISQWSLAIPGTAISTWFLFLLVYYFTKKSPISGELVFASVIVSLPGLGGGNAEVAAMLISIAAVAQILYFIGFLLTLERSPTAFVPSKRHVLN